MVYKTAESTFGRLGPFSISVSQALSVLILANSWIGRVGSKYPQESLRRKLSLCEVGWKPQVLAHNQAKASTLVSFRL